MKRRVQSSLGTLRGGAALLVLATGASSCDTTSGPLPLVTDCGTAAQDPTFCCDASTYDAVDPAVVRDSPGAVVGRRIAVRGLADVFVNSPGTDICECFGEVCGCATDLAVRTSGCDGLPAAVPLGGDYSQREVACTESCYPLSSGLSYAVCGTFVYDALGSSGDAGKKYYLTVESFCNE